MASDPTQAAVAAFLGDPATHGGREVERVDTHGAMVFLAGDLVLKLKRAVSFPYMDFSTPQKRHRACEAEVRLNRRTAPGLYLGVEPVVRRPDGTLALGGKGEAVDWVVRMRRFDQSRLFDRLAGRDALTPDLMRRLAEAVAAFHAGAEVRRDNGASAMRWVVEENIAELRAAPELFAPERVERLARLSAAALDRLSPLMDRRRDEGFVRFCHGDLHLRNIVLVDGRPTLFDCIEFNDALAVIDVLYDLAFLVMDLEALGRRDLASAVFNRYLEETADLEGLALLPLFLSARAAVRAKISASAAMAQSEPARGDNLRRDAMAYLERAVELLEPACPRLVAVGGLSGTGKTTLARALAPGIGPVPGAVVLRSDALRKRLMGVGEEERLPEAGYAPAVTKRVYAEIRRRAGVALRAGHGVVADAVHARAEEREAIERVADEAGVPFTGVWLDAGSEILVRRVAARMHDASDATQEVVRRQLAYDLGDVSWLRVDASGDFPLVVAAAGAALEP
ncbi:MAG TPA: AAA family ATPase [Azospirillaceae bacterium]|nr:AAA family ATPase [Azospirillaceae bacterium]